MMDKAVDPDSISYPVIYDGIDGLPPHGLPYRVNAVIVVVCQTGSLSIKVDGKLVEVTPSTMMVMRRGHTVQSYEVSAGFKGYMIVAPPHLLSPSPAALTQYIRCMAYYKGRSIIRLTESQLATQVAMRDILRERTSQLASDGGPTPPFIDKVVRSLALAVFYETLSVYTAGMGKCGGAPSSRKEEIICRFIDMVERDYIRERKVKYYADGLCITPKHLASVCRDVTGRTPAQWISGYVVLEAKAMLEEDRLSVQQVSDRLNFPGQSFFGRYFRNATGMSPREYRAHALNRQA